MRASDGALWRATVVRWVTLALTVAAFAASYKHGVTWATSHTQPGSRGFWVWLTAGLPEVMVALSVLIAIDNPRAIRVWVIGSVAVGWTLWANGSAAGPGLSGLVVALWPALAALSALWLAGHGPGHPAEPSAVPEPVPMTRAIRKRAIRAEPSDPVYTEPSGHQPAEPLAAVTRAEPSGDGSGPGHGGPADTAMARGVRWVMAQPELPSRATIQDTIGCSAKTASRIRTAASAARAPSEGNHV